MLMQRGIVAVLAGLAGLASTGEAISSSVRAKAEFEAAMMSGRDEKLSRYAKEHKDKLRRSLLEKAVPADSKKIEPMRRLADNDDGEYDYYPFNFDASLYSVKYSGCHRISQLPDDRWDDGAGGGVDGESYYTYKYLVAFRLCESESCSKGCRNNYGEYVIALEDYLEAMTEYKKHVSGYYCDYCEMCMFFENYFYGHRNLDEVNEGDDVYGEELDEAEEEEYEEYYANDDDDGGHACKYYNECADYLDFCEANGQGNNDDGNGYYYQEAEDLEGIFECHQLNYYYDGNVVYGGAYCGNDHHTIGLGVFKDQYCTEYIGNKVDFIEASGVNISTSEIEFYYDDACIPCNDNAQQFKVASLYGEDGDGEVMLDLCESMYESSAKCQMNLVDEYGFYGTLTTSTQESANCEFVESISTGQYDDNGFLYINKLLYVRSILDYVPAFEQCTLIQQIGLVLSVFACIVQYIRAKCYEYSLKKTQKKQPNLLRNEKAEFNHGSATENNEDYQEIKQSESQKLGVRETISGGKIPILPGGFIPMKRFDSLDSKYKDALKRIGDLEKASRNYINEIASSFDSTKGKKNSTDSKDEEAEKVQESQKPPLPRKKSSSKKEARKPPLAPKSPSGLSATSSEKV